jgi:response regulator NasT
LKPDLVIMDIRFEGVDFDGIDAARILTEEDIAPVLLLSAYSQRDLVDRAREAGVVGYLVKPFSEADLPPAIETALERFREFRAIKKEARDLRRTLETRKAVDRAKGLLMDKEGMSEAEAFRRIQKLSMDSRKPMRVVAEAIILAHQIREMEE